MPEETRHSNASDILDAALEYLDRGLSVIPTIPWNKKAYIPWKEFQAKIPDESTVRSWFERFPDANVSIITGSVSKIFSVDADGPEGVEWCKKNLPPTPVWNRTREDRVQFIYRIPKGVLVKCSSREIHYEVDTRGEGGYFVAPPSKHHLGHLYAWEFGEGGWDELPEFDPSCLFQDQSSGSSSGNLKDIDWNKVGSGLDIVEVLNGVDKGRRDITLFRYACRLRGKNMSPEEAFALVQMAAGQCNPPISDKIVREKLESAWKYTPGDMKDDEPLEPPSIVKSHDLKDTDEFPKNLLFPGGILQDLINYIDANSPISIKQFNLAASLSFLGSILGQKVMTKSGLRTNLMCISLGYSGVGKNAPHNALSELLIQSTAHPIMGPTTVTSDSSIMRRLSVQGQEVTFMLLDEFGHILKGIKKPLSVEAKIPALLTKLFSGTSHGESKEYASGEKLIVQWHHVSLYATSTPGRFWEDLTFADFADGFLARANIFESQEGSKDKKSIINTMPPDLLVKAIDDLYSIEFKWLESRGNLANVIHRRPAPMKMEMSNKALSIFSSWEQHYQDLQNKNRKSEDGISAIYARCAEHAAKIALIHHMSLHGSDGVDKKIGEASVEWAMELVDHLTGNTIQKMTRHIAENPFDQLQKRIIRYIEANITDTRPGAAKSRIQNHLKIKKRDFEEVIDSMESSGIIFINREYKPTRGFKPEGGLVCLVKESKESEE